MKFSSVILVGLGLFVASCSAACDCKASDQACLNKCVTAANACIVKCEDKGNACQQECISSNWPSFAVMQKDVLGENTANPTGTAEASAPTGVESMNADSGHHKVSVTGAEAVATSLPTSAVRSGSAMASASASFASVMKPASSSGAKPTTSPKSNVDTTTTSSTSDSSRQFTIGWTATLAVLFGTVAYAL